MVNGGAGSSTSTFNNDVYAADVNISGNGIIVMADGADINGVLTPVTTARAC